MRFPRWLAIALAVALAGCASLLKSGIGRPTVALQEARLAALSFQGASLQFAFDVRNPNPVGLRLDGFEYALSVEGASLLDGRQDAAVELAAGGHRTVELPVNVRYRDLWTALRQVAEKRDAAYVLEAGFFFDVPALGRVRVPLRREGSLPLLRLPTVRVDQVAVRGLSTRGADLAVTLSVENPNDVGADLQGIDSALTVQGAPLGRLTSDRTVHVPARGTARIEVPVRLDLAQLTSALATLLRQGGVVDYALAGDLSLTSASLPEFRPAEVPFDGSGRTELRTGSAATR